MFHSVEQILADRHSSDPSDESASRRFVNHLHQERTDPSSPESLDHRGRPTPACARRRSLAVLPRSTASTPARRAVLPPRQQCRCRRPSPLVEDPHLRGCRRRPELESRAAAVRPPIKASPSVSRQEDRVCRRRSRWSPSLRSPPIHSSVPRAPTSSRRPNDRQKHMVWRIQLERLVFELWAIQVSEPVERLPHPRRSSGQFRPQRRQLGLLAIRDSAGRGRRRRGGDSWSRAA